MDEDTLIPPSAPESGLPEKKKRGRKPKNQTAESSDSQTAPKIAKKRGRPKKAKVPEEETVGTGAQSEDAPTESVAESGSVETASSNASDNNAAASSGPQWRDVHVEAEDSYSPDNEIFTGTDSGDDFAYSKTRKFRNIFRRATKTSTRTHTAMSPTPREVPNPTPREIPSPTNRKPYCPTLRTSRLLTPKPRAKTGATTARIGSKTRARTISAAITSKTGSRTANSKTGSKTSSGKTAIFHSRTASNRTGSKTSNSSDNSKTSLKRISGSRRKMTPKR